MHTLKHLSSRSITCLPLSLRHLNKRRILSWSRSASLFHGKEDTNVNDYAFKRYFRASSLALSNVESLKGNSVESISHLENNDELAKDDLGLDSLVIAPRAERRILALRKKGAVEGKPNAENMLLRLRVDGGGCGGFKYEFSLEYDSLEEDDMTFGRNGPIAVIDEVSLEFVKGATIDWDDSMVRSAFVVAHNPNAETSCGCKSSFSMKL